MARLIVLLILILAGDQASAGTLSPWVDIRIVRSVEPDPDFFARSTSSYPLFHQKTVKLEPVVVSHSGLVLWLTFAFSIALVASAEACARSIPPQASRVAFAKSWTRWIMALRPLERWDERWSRKSSRASSASASTVNASRAVKPL